MARNKSNVFSNIGASTHSEYEREENDFYSTDPIAIAMLHRTQLLDHDKTLWECACGDGSMSKELKRLGYNVISSDLYDRGYGATEINFLEQSELERFHGDIITNPPYKYINDFIVKGLKLTGRKLFIFCRVQTLEGQERYKRIFRDNPPLYILPFVKRVPCYRGGDLSQFKKKSSAVCYAWFVWNILDQSKECRIKWLI